MRPDKTTDGGGMGVSLISLRREAWAEVRRHEATNRDYRRHRDALHVRFLRRLLTPASLTWGLIAYLVVALAITAVEVLNDAYCRVTECPAFLPLALIRSERSEDILREVAGFMIGAQAGLLGVLSIAVALVSLIGQRVNAGADVRIYYHQSFAVPLAGSCLALLAVLLGQLFWPIELLSPDYGLGSSNLSAEVALTNVHLVWLIGNIFVSARFLLISLSFGEEHNRSRFRAQYTANVIARADRYRAIFRRRYSRCATRFTSAHGENGSIRIGSSLLGPSNEAVGVTFTSPHVLDDVWLGPLLFVAHRWAKRVDGAERGAVLAFTIDADHEMDGHQTICLASPDQALTAWERLIIRHSFRFRRLQ